MVQPGHPVPYRAHEEDRPLIASTSKRKSPCENPTGSAPSALSNWHSITHFASCQSPSQPTISSNEPPFVSRLYLPKRLSHSNIYLFSAATNRLTLPTRAWPHTRPLPLSRMSTLKQIEANRLNAQKSTGPRTTEGKSAVRLNALKHGLFALDPIIPAEDPANFEALRTTHYDRFQPAPPEEHVLLATMVRDAWSLERFSNAETGMWAYSMERNKNDSNPLARSQMHLDRSLSQVQRRVDSAQRNYRRNLELLIKLQAIRKKAEPAPQPKSP